MKTPTSISGARQLQGGVFLRMMEQQHSDGDLALEAIKVKILLLGDEGAPHSIRVELSSEADLFFHYMHVVDEVGFRMMQESQKLMVELCRVPKRSRPDD